MNALLFDVQLTLVAPALVIFGGWALYWSVGEQGWADLGMQVRTLVLVTRP